MKLVLDSREGRICALNGDDPQCWKCKKAHRSTERWHFIPGYNAMICQECLLNNLTDEEQGIAMMLYKKEHKHHPFQYWLIDKVSAT